MTHNRKMVFFSTPVQVSVKQVSKKGEITDPLMLVALNQRIMDMQAELLSLGVSVEHYSASSSKTSFCAGKKRKAGRSSRASTSLLFGGRNFFPPSGTSGRASCTQHP